ncbi:MAG: UDP-glucuronic acid decarboxylase family protein [Planctomycetota bacterium]
MKDAILITGGAGFIGSHLCEYFYKESFKVVCVDNLITGRQKNLSGLAGKPGFRFLKKDISQGIKTGIRNLKAVLHFASPASPKDYIKYPIETLRTGSFGTYSALELARVNRARFLLASTSEVYGDPLKHPQDESYWGNVNPIGQRSVYDEAKRFAEAITMAYHREYKVDTRIARIFNTYGPRMRLNDGRALPNFFYQALKGEDITVYGNGRQTRSFCYIDDLVDGLAKLLWSKEHQPVNLGNPEEIPIKQLASEVKEVCGSTSKIRFEPLPEDDPVVRRPDISRATRILGWQPKVSRVDGLKKTLEYFRGLVTASRA